MKQGIIAIWALAAVFCPLTAGAQSRGKEPQNTLRPLEGKAPQNVEELYADFDPRREPLETQTVREWRKDGIQYRYVVYTVGTFRGRKARMAAFYGFPEGGERLPALLHLHGGGQRAFVKEVKRFAGRGYACLSINWGGRPMETMRPGEPNTDWGAVDPTQKNVPGYSNLLPGPKTVDDVESPRNNNWFLLNLGARRGITFLEQQPEVDAERIGVYGHSMGGRLTGLVAGTDDRVKAASPSVGGSGFLQTDLPGLPGSRRPVKGDLALFQRTISGQAYLERVQCPILFLSASNDFNAPMDFVGRGMTLVPHTMRYETYAPHLNHRFTPPHEICRPLWFDAHLKRTFVFPETPRAELVLERENGVPLFRVTPDASRTIARVDIYYGYERDPRNRFWADGRAVRRGDVWEAECPVFDLAEPLFVFANVHYRLESRSRGDPHTFALSVFRAAYPPELKEAGVRPTAKRDRLIDDFSRGWRDWYMLDSGNPRRWRFTTRKLADPRWAGPEGARLAFEVDTKTSGNVLAVELQVNKWRGYTRRPEGTFVARVPLTVRGSNKVSLGLEDFKETKDPRRTLSCWSEITELTFRSASKSAPWEQAASSFRNLRWEDGEYGPTSKPFLPAGGDDAVNWQETGAAP